MIDTSKEQVYSLPDFAKELKKQRHIDKSYRTIRDWVKNGWSPRGRTEPVIKLEATPLMGVDLTSFEAFDRFMRAQYVAEREAELAS